MIKWLPLLFCFFVFGTSGIAQTIIDVNLTASPNITKTYTGYERSGTDCGGSNCIIFNITLNQGSDLVSFDASQVTGASSYSIDCGPLTPVGTAACISGKTQVRISFCKVGGNTNVIYTISASTSVKASNDVTVRTGCSEPLSVVGLDPASTRWTSIFPGTEGAYNSLLSCTSGCTATTFTAGPTPPAYIDYKVSGTVSSCPNLRADTVRVYVVPGMAVSFNSANAVICSGSAATLSPTVTGGNPAYTYSWKKDGVQLTQTTSSISVTEIGTYMVTVADNTNCAPVSQSIVVTESPTPAAPTANGAVICAGSATSLSATAPGGAYEWYDASVGGNLLISNATYVTPILFATKTYYVQTVVNGCTSPRTPVEVVVNPIPNAPTAADITICSGNTGTLMATAPGGTYQWFDASSGGTLLNSTDTFVTPILNSSVTYYVQTTVNGCTSSRTAVAVTVNPTPAAPTASGAAICNGTSTTLTATGPGGNYQWFDVPTGGVPLISSSTYTTPALTSNTTYYVQTTLNDCISARTEVIVLVDAIPDAPTISGVTICSGSSTVLTPTAPGGLYQWFTVASGGTPLATAASYTTPTLTENTTYYVQTVVNGCVSSRVSVTVIVNPIPAAPSVLDRTICSGNSAVLTATAPGGTYEWYSDLSGGTLLGTEEIFNTPVLSSTTTYYVQATINDCTSSRTSVTVTVIPTPAAPTVMHPSICSGSSVTLTATAPGGDYKWFDAAIGGNILSQTANYNTPVLTATTIYYVETTVNGCTSERTAVTVTVYPLPAAPTASGGTICSGNALTLSATAPGGVYRWYNASVQGTLLDSDASFTTPVLTVTTTYYVEAVSAEGCVGPRTAVTVIVIPEENADFAYSSGTYCTSSTIDPIPTITNPAGGIFTSTSGLSINSATGEIDVSASSLGTYTITFVTNTDCPNSSSYDITITGAPNAAFSYPTVYCRGQSSPATPVFPTGSSAGKFSSTSGLVFRNDLTGEIDLQASTPGTYFVTNTIAEFGGCAEAIASNSVQINPTPIVTSTAAAVLCNKVLQNYQITSSIPGASYSWSRALVSGISNPEATAQTSEIITEQLENTTSAPIDVIYGIIPSVNGCVGPTFSYLVTVNPTPTITSQPSAIICNKASQNYAISSNVTGVSYKWSRAAITGISNPEVIDQTSSFITEQLENTTGSPIEVVYELVPTANQCDGPTFFYRVTVNPTPRITSALIGVICSNNAQNYLITSNVQSSAFTWSRLAVSGISNAAISGQTGTSINETLINTTTSAIVVSYQLNASAFNCDGPLAIYKVTVNPTPFITSALNEVICNNTAQNYTIRSNVNFSTFTWSREAVAGIDNAAVSLQSGSAITETLVNTTTSPISVVYQLSATSDGCTGPTASYTVKVNPTPHVISAETALICNSTPQNYTIVGDVSGSTFTWSRAAVLGISNTLASNQVGPITEALTNTTDLPIEVVYTIRPTANGCEGIVFNYKVTVNPTARVTSAVTNVICNDTAQDYLITSNVSTASFKWSRAAVAGISNIAVTGQTSDVIAEKLINTTDLPINVTYSIVPVAFDCPGPSFNYTVKVNPTARITSGINENICNQIPLNYQITSNVATAAITWSRAAVPGVSNIAVPDHLSDFISETLLNTTVLPVNVIYLISASTNACKGPEFSYTVSVDPTAVITSASKALICNNTAQSYTITSNVSAAAFTWSRISVPGISNPTVTGQTGAVISEKLFNRTTAPIDVVYQITASAYGCNGPSFTYTVTVNPTPVITSASSDIICNNTVQTYEIKSNVSNTTFSWSRAEVAGISNTRLTGTGNRITEQLENTSSEPIEVIYEIVPTANECGGLPFFYKVVVVPTPNVTTATASSICNNTAQDYTIAGNVEGTTFSWSRAAVPGISNGSVDNETGTLISETLTNTTDNAIAVVYQIYPKVYNCEGPVFTYTVSVNPTPVVISASREIICNQTSQNYQITSNISSATYTWSRAAVPGINNQEVTSQTSDVISEKLENTTQFPIAVLYEIVPLLEGCNGPVFNYTVTVNPTPLVNSATSANICNNTPQDYTITANMDGVSFIWRRAATVGISNDAAVDQSSGVIAEALVNTTSAAIDVVYEIIPTASNCNGPLFVYTVRVNPTVVVNSALNGKVCNQTTHRYTINSNVSTASFSWSRAEIAGIENPAASSQSGNTIEEKLVNNTDLPIVVPYQIIPSLNGCKGSTYTYNLTISPTPRITNTSLNQTVCSTSSSVAISPESNVTGTTFSWTATASPGITGFIASGVGTIPAQILRNAFPGSGNITYTIRPSIDGCPGIASDYVITVLNQVPVTPEASNNSPVCVGNSLTLSTQSVEGATYNWSGPNGFTSTSRTPVINNVAIGHEGIYTATITVGQCAASANTTVTLNRPVFVSAGNDQTVCANNSVVQIIGAVSGGSTTGIWTSSGSGIFPSGATALSGSYVPSEADKASGNIRLTLTATNTATCEATSAYFQLIITPSPIVSAGVDRVICAYEPLILTGQSTTANVKWTSSGSGKFTPDNTSINASYIPSTNDKTNGRVTITLSTQEPSNCIPVTDQLNLLIVPAPTVSLGEDVLVLEGESKVLSPSNITGDDLQYLWTPNINLNDNTLRNPIFKGTSDTRYTLTVTGRGGCKAVDRFFVKVLKPVRIPNAFSPNGDGLNDTWAPQEIENYPGAEISIFNRYGVKLYSGHAKDFAWDGTYKGTPLPVGMYYYILDLKEYSKPMTGNIMIMR